MNFNEKMKLLRNELGLTQEQASAKIPMSIASIKNYEKDRFPDSRQLRRIKEFYKVPYEYLLNDECNTREEENIKIGEQLGLSDKSISMLKEISYNGNIKMLEQLLEYIYNKDILLKLEEISKVNYIIDTMFNKVCPELEKIFKAKKYENIADQQLNALDYFLRYNISIREKTKDIQEQNYLRYLIADNIEYAKFVDNLMYIIQTFNYKANVNENELKTFNNCYKKIKQIFINYKTFLNTTISTSFDNDFIKQINLNNKTI